jgi:hypothetical protein
MGWLEAGAGACVAMPYAATSYRKRAGFVATPALAAAVLASLRGQALQAKLLSLLRACVRCVCGWGLCGSFEDLAGDGNFLLSRSPGQAKGSFGLGQRAAPRHARRKKMYKRCCSCVGRA